MWDKIFQFITGRMIGMGQEPLNIKSHSNLDKVNLWSSIYEGQPPWKTPYSSVLTTGSDIASEMARLTTVELESTVDGGVGAEFLNNDYQLVLKRLRVNLEYALVKGGVIFRPYKDGDRIGVECVHPENYVPLRFDYTGRLVNVVFIDVFTKDKLRYTRLEEHNLTADRVNTVTNKVYEGSENKDALGKEVPLSTVKKWADLPEEDVTYDVEYTLFSYFKTPFANSEDPHSHLGVSVYSNIVGLIEEADNLYNSTLWEYEGSELAIDASIDLFNSIDPLPRSNSKIFRKLDDQTGSLYNIFSPQIRDSNYWNGVNEIRRLMEFSVGLAYGTLSHSDQVEKTATEIISSKERSYSTIFDIKKSVEEALENLVGAMSQIAKSYGMIGADQEYEVNFPEVDGIIVDQGAEMALMLQEVDKNIIKPVYYIMERYGKTYEEAMEMIPTNQSEPAGNVSQPVETLSDDYVEDLER